jgi:hypothetical protein
MRSERVIAGCRSDAMRPKRLRRGGASNCLSIEFLKESWRSQTPRSVDALSHSIANRTCRYSATVFSRACVGPSWFVSGDGKPALSLTQPSRFAGEDCRRYAGRHSDRSSFERQVIECIS